MEAGTSTLRKSCHTEDDRLRRSERKQPMAPRSIMVTGANGLIGFDLVRRPPGRRPRRRGGRQIDLRRPSGDGSGPSSSRSATCTGSTSLPRASRSMPSLIAAGSPDPCSAGTTRQCSSGSTWVARSTSPRWRGRAAGLRGSCRLVFCSSLTVYGNQPDDGIGEDHPLLARGCYASSKVAGEAVVLSYAADHGVDGVVLRIAGGVRRAPQDELRASAHGGGCARRETDAHALRQGLPAAVGPRRRRVVQGIVGALDASHPRRRVYNISGGVNPHIDEGRSPRARAAPRRRHRARRGS